RAERGDHGRGHGQRQREPERPRRLLLGTQGQVVAHGAGRQGAQAGRRGSDEGGQLAGPAGPVELRPLRRRGDDRGRAAHGVSSRWRSSSRSISSANRGAKVYTALWYASACRAATLLSVSEVP